MDWPDKNDLEKRFKTLLEINKSKKFDSILDFGCGIGLLVDYMNKHNLEVNDYIGIDISGKFISYAKKKASLYAFIKQDIMEKPLLSVR